jgi:serine protease Do
MRALPRVVAATEIGSKAEIDVWRDGSELHLSASIGKLPDDESEPPAPAPAPDPELGEGPMSDEGKEELLGLAIAPLTEELRKKYRIGNNIDGVVIVSVAANSVAAQQRLKPGDVIVEVTQEKVTDPQEVMARVDQVKESGKKSVVLLVSDAKGGLRFIAVPIG